MTTMHGFEYLPSIAELHQSFAQEITSLGGRVRDAFDDGERLYARGVLPSDAEVRPGDVVSAGVAMRAVRSGIEIHPYTLRRVCTNGLIRHVSLGSERLERFE